ncbi:MAG: serine/threonine protein kinase [Alphaproteobacteria bacterium]|nr:serine/threonine protein kinase [Alphaproteobacteria bacterium]
MPPPPDTAEARVRALLRAVERGEGVEEAARSLLLRPLGEDAIETDPGLPPSLSDLARGALDGSLPPEVILEGLRRWLPPPEAPRYDIGGRLGRGGMADVLLAVDAHMHREVAIKRLRGDLTTPGRVTRFLQEAQIIAQLEHPNIVPVYDVGFEEDGRPWFVMKRVRGRSIAELLADGDLGSTRRRLDILCKVCDAVAFAHSRGVLHRDLKPGNVMVGAYGEVLVMDWGLAKVVAQPQDPDAARPVETDTPDPTGYGQVRGTPAYMPPEQARGDVDRVGQQADVYAIGALLYALLAGVAPYAGDDPFEILAAVQSGMMEAPNQRADAADIPEELEAVILKAMAFDPEARYPDVLTLRAELQAWIDGRPLASVDYTRQELLRKWAWRNRFRLRIAAAAAALVLVAVLGVVVAVLVAR